ncbi:hypothetical protein [Actinokineospora globicatena]|nr:hypothetical protein [Actinokineospora globicatena]
MLIDALVELGAVEEAQAIFAERDMAADSALRGVVTTKPLPTPTNANRP